MKHLALIAIAAMPVMLSKSATAAPIDTTTVTLNASNLGASYPAPYGTVTINLLSSTSAELIFQSGPGYIFVDSQAADANFNGSVSWSLGSCNSVSTNCGSSAGAQNSVDSAGSFSNTWDLKSSGANDRATTIDLIATLTGGSWGTSAANVLVGNDHSLTLAAHVGACAATDPTCTGTLLATGYANNGSGGPIPEPASLAVLGAAICSLGALVRRRRHSGIERRLKRGRFIVGPDRPMLD